MRKGYHKSVEESKNYKVSVELVTRMDLQGQAVGRDRLQEDINDAWKCTSSLEGDQDSSYRVDT